MPGISNANPMASVMNPGVTNNAPDTKIIEPCTISLVGISPFANVV